MFQHEQGMAGTVLVIVIAWALAAVLMLTGTLVAARQIDETVAEIRGTVSGIDDNLDAIEMAEETTEISSQILSAAQPIEGQLDEVLVAADDIDGSASSILSTAGEIDGTVNSISGTAGEINSTVGSIQSNLSNTNSHVSSISQGVTDINHRADTIIGHVRSIQSDTSGILHEVREAEPGNDGIRGHAHSIDCSPAVFATSTHCSDGPSGAGDLLDLDDLLGGLLGG